MPQLVTWNGFDLFTFSRDSSRFSACTRRCTRVWVPVITSGPPRAETGSTIRRRRLGTIRRPDGRLQATYYGKPLYRERHMDICSPSGPGWGDGPYSVKGFGGSFSLINVVGGIPTGLCGPY